MKDPKEAQRIVAGKNEMPPASECKSFEERICYLIETKQMDSEEFKQWLFVFKRDHLVNIWKRFKEEKNK